ncbi:MAG: hypothetical protein IJF18_00510 [Oscillospiraceae bacterium]|nr:hypothetical protein [Oscillospiraceae bacterium]
MKKLVLSLLFLLTIVTALIPYDTAPLEISTNVIHTNNYVHGFEAYEHNYLITSKREYKIFRRYMQEDAIPEKIDFNKYALAVIPFQYSDRVPFEAGDVTISGNTLTLPYEAHPPEAEPQSELLSGLYSWGIISDPVFQTRYYIYALIPQNLLTEKSYDGWVAPSKADTSEYFSYRFDGECPYSREAVLKTIEICDKYDFYYIRGKIEFNSETGKSKISLWTDSCNTDENVQQAVSEFKELGYCRDWTSSRQIPASQFVMPDSLVLDRSSCAEIYITSENGDDILKAAEYLKTFEGKTFYENTQPERIGYYDPKTNRRWEVITEDISDTMDAFEYIRTLPDIPVKLDEIIVSVDFEFTAE